MMISSSRRSLKTAALYAAILAAAGNSILYFVYYVTGIIPWDILSPGRGVSITPKLVIFVSIGGALGGALMYAILRQVSSNPAGKFRVYAAIALLLSFGAPLLIETFTTPLTIALDLMHVVVFASTVYALTVWLDRTPVKATG